ncbi:hypothetical protein Rhe02_94930 [Rhizocola hellebori]|uniref:DUF2516 family protein n=1 Tax=Rhizocola hellebori TaxID=1392758 RepID=A0A8J3VML6_9ACTN|nr:DUF2516 family protein [Rhizocola hellebori]GIH11426.1 hypothetical protein Rhe02_94930 [Rhizocola hellebori]
MAIASPFAFGVEAWVNFLISVLALVLMLWALIHVATQRPDAFAAIGGLQKHHWLGLLGALFALALIFFLFAGGFPLIEYIGIAASAFYLLDTRRGLKDVTEGRW